MSKYFIINPQDKIINLILSEGVPSSEVLRNNTAKPLEELILADTGDYYISNSDTLVKTPNVLTNNASSSLLTDSVEIQLTLSRNINSFNIKSTKEGVEIDSLVHVDNQITFNLTTGSIKSLKNHNIEEEVEVIIQNIIDADGRDFSRPISFGQPIFIPSSSVE